MATIIWWQLFDYLFTNTKDPWPWVWTPRGVWSCGVWSPQVANGRAAPPLTTPHARGWNVWCMDRSAVTLEESGLGLHWVTTSFSFLARRHRHRQPSPDYFQYHHAPPTIYFRMKEWVVASAGRIVEFSIVFMWLKMFSKGWSYGKLSRNTSYHFHSVQKRNLE